jgi:hypothetical protein
MAAYFPVHAVSYESLMILWNSFSFQLHDYLIPWSRVILQKLKISQLVSKFPDFLMVNYCVYSSATVLYPEAYEFNPHHLALFL